jgi:hypothetical protein
MKVVGVESLFGLFQKVLLVDFVREWYFSDHVLR